MNPKFTRERLEQFWSDPANWTFGLIYRCHEDPRVIVPRRRKWRGWTLNFAHRYAIPTLILLGLAVGMPLNILAAYDLNVTWIWWTVLSGTLAILCLACWYWASPDRYV
jgi:hypothetical protein